MKIADFLTEGEKNAVSLADLAFSTGLNTRLVKREVLQARLRGELILSSENGYFLPENADDIRRYVYARQAYLKTARSALRPFVKAMKV